MSSIAKFENLKDLIVEVHGQPHWVLGISRLDTGSQAKVEIDKSEV